MSTFTFNGITKGYIRIARDWSLPAWAPITREYLKVPGRPGVVPVGMETEERRFELPIILAADSFEEKEQLIEELAEWLIQEKAVPLKFSKYPNRTLYAQIEGTPNFPEFLRNGKGTLSVVCPDPYKYGEISSTPFIDGAAIVFNTGTATASPVYEIDVLSDITHVDVFSDKAYTRLGEPAPIDEPVYERQTLIFSDTMKMMTGWSDAVDVDNGYVGGTMAATQAGFEVTAFGVAVKPFAWQGPAKVKSLPEPVENFRIDVPIELLNVDRETGMIEIYLLDAFGNTVAKIGMEDVWATLKKNQAKFQLGNVDKRKVQYHRTADYVPAWNDFRGMLRLHRDGNLFRPYFAQVQPNGTHVWISQQWTYRDESKEYLAAITQIKVAIRKWPGSSTSQAKMRIGGIKVWRYNDPAEGLPYIARAGDKITIDAQEGAVFINGELREDLNDWFGDFFDLPKGQTTLLIQPSDKVSGKVTIQERFL